MRRSPPRSSTPAIRSTRPTLSPTATPSSLSRGPTSAPTKTRAGRSAGSPWRPSRRWAPSGAPPISATATACWCLRRSSGCRDSDRAAWAPSTRSMTCSTPTGRSTPAHPIPRSGSTSSSSTLSAAAARSTSVTSRSTEREAAGLGNHQYPGHGYHRFFRRRADRHRRNDHLARRPSHVRDEPERQVESMASTSLTQTSRRRPRCRLTPRWEPTSSSGPSRRYRNRLYLGYVDTGTPPGAVRRGCRDEGLCRFDAVDDPGRRGRQGNPPTPVWQPELTVDLGYAKGSNMEDWPVRPSGTLNPAVACAPAGDNGGKPAARQP